MMQMDNAVREASVLSTPQAVLQVKLEDEASSTAQLYLALYFGADLRESEDSKS